MFAKLIYYFVPQLNMLEGFVRENVPACGLVWVFRGISNHSQYMQFKSVSRTFLIVAKDLNMNESKMSSGYYMVLYSDSLVSD